jgi:uncharacterized protein YqgC (DUF456 family)
LAKKITVPCESNRKKVKHVIVPPNEHLIIGIIFAIMALIVLTILEIAHLVFLKTWNSEIFAALTSIIGTILGVFISQKA